METITRTELELMQQFLQECGEEFADHSCNDFTLPATEGNKALFAAVLKQHAGDEGDDGGLSVDGIMTATNEVFIYDDWLLIYFAQRCADLLKPPPGSAGLTAVELDALGELLRYACSWREDQSVDLSFDETFLATAENKLMIAAALRDMSPVIDQYDDPGMRTEATQKAATAAKIILKSTSEDDEIDIPEFWLMYHFGFKCSRLSLQIAPSGAPFSLPDHTGADGGRLGIDPKWAKKWRSTCKNNMTWVEENEQGVLQGLAEYVQNGVIVSKSDHVPDEVTPPERRWESISLKVNLGCLAEFYLARMDAQALKSKPVNWRDASHSFAALYTEVMIDVEDNNKSRARYGVDPWRLHVYRMPFIALGMVLGCDKEATGLARIFAASHRKGYLRDREKYPIFAFMLRILVDYLGEAPITLSGAAASEPTFNELFSLWRCPDPEKLAPVCLAACDCHTWRCGYSSKEDREFDGGAWTHTPIEILLLFKLRQSLGLANPVLDHPLMQSPLASPPLDPVAFEPDDLVASVRTRMMQDGYDEDAIYNEAVQS